MSNRYVIGFGAQGMSIKNRSPGHAYVFFGIEDYDARKSATEVFGFGPDDLDAGIVTMLSGTAGSVWEGLEQNGIIDSSDTTFIAEVDVSDFYRAAFSITNRFSTPTYVGSAGDTLLNQSHVLPSYQNYSVPADDCVMLDDTVAAAIGLHRPFESTSPMSFMPQTYVHDLSIMNPAPYGANLESGQKFVQQSFQVMGQSGPGKLSVVGFADDNGLLHGTAQISFPSGAVFAGHFEHGVAKGGSILFYPDGSRLIGNYDRSVLTQGTFIDTAGIAQPVQIGASGRYPIAPTPGVQKVSGSLRRVERNRENVGSI